MTLPELIQHLRDLEAKATENLTDKILDKWEIQLKPAVTGTFPVDDANELIRLSRLGLKLEEAIEVISFYAVKENWKREWIGEFPIHEQTNSKTDVDQGQKAREFLARLKEGKK